MEIISNKVYSTYAPLTTSYSFDKDAQGFNTIPVTHCNAHTPCSSPLTPWCVAGLCTYIDPSAAENAGKEVTVPASLPGLCVCDPWDWSFFSWSYTFDCDSCGARFISFTAGLDKAGSTTEGAVLSLRSFAVSTTRARFLIIPCSGGRSRKKCYCASRSTR